jgi:hypothetical protein
VVGSRRLTRDRTFFYSSLARISYVVGFNQLAFIIGLDCGQHLKRLARHWISKVHWASAVSDGLCRYFSLWNLGFAHIGDTQDNHVAYSLLV